MSMLKFVLYGKKKEISLPLEAEESKNVRGNKMWKFSMILLITMTCMRFNGLYFRT